MRVKTDLTEETKDDSNESNETASESGKYDISEVLRLTGHRIAEYPNGLTLGVRLEGIPDTRGVHVDVVFVLDLRKAAFGRGGLAMRAAVLETVNRDLEKVLADVGFGDCIVDHTVLTPWERIRLPLLKAREYDSFSQMHQTRAIYVITEDAKPRCNLSWLTDTSRIITTDQFSLAMQSDSRSRLPDLKNCIQGEKWRLLEIGVVKGWTGLLAAISFAIALATLATALVTESGSTILPLFICVASGLLGSWLLISSKQHLSLFNNILTREQQSLQTIGDGKRISNAIAENEEKLRLLVDLNFVVSPLIANVGSAVGNNDVDAAVNTACSVLDECVRLAPKTSEHRSTVSGDRGLQAFIGLFEHLSGNFNETKLALAYVGLTGHVTKPIAFREAIAHLTELVNSLFDIGALRPNIKESIDDRLNMIALKEAADEIGNEMLCDETIIPRSDLESEEICEYEGEGSSGSITPMFEDSHDYDDALHEQILHASKTSNYDKKGSSDEAFGTETDFSDELTIIGENVVNDKMKNQECTPRKPTQVVLGDFERLCPADESEERESVGV